MTKVLFIYPNELVSLQKQIGIAHLSAMLKVKGIDAVLFDYTLKDESDLEEMMYKYKPDAMAVSARSGDYQTCLNLAKRCKEVKPDVRIVFGGVHPILDHLHSSLKNLDKMITNILK